MGLGDKLRSRVNVRKLTELFVQTSQLRSIFQPARGKEKSGGEMFQSDSDTEKNSRKKAG